MGTIIHSSTAVAQSVAGRERRPTNALTGSPGFTQGRLAREISGVPIDDAMNGPAVVLQFRDDLVSIHGGKVAKTPHI